MAISPSTGKKKWGVDIFDNGSHPAIDNKIIYIATGDSNLYAIEDNGSNGSVKWKTKMPSWFTVSPMVDGNGTIYCVLYDGKLYAVEPNNGNVLWIGQGSRAMVTPPVIGEDGSLYIGQDRGCYSMGPWLAGYWPFNDETGSIVTENTGNAINGNIHDAVWVENAACGYSLYFDGQGDYVEIPYTPSIKPESEITVEYWFQMGEPSDSTLLSTVHSGGYTSVKKCLVMK